MGSHDECVMGCFCRHSSEVCVNLLIPCSSPGEGSEKSAPPTPLCMSCAVLS